MKAIIALLALVGFAQAISYADVLETEWKNYRFTYNKIYDDREMQIRKEVFINNLKKIDAHNQRFEAGKETYEMGINDFADLSAKEFSGRMLASLDISLDKGDRRNEYVKPENYALPASVDWRARGAVTAVKDQGSCASCWTFSTTGVLEGHNFLKTGRLVSLSEQNLLDCSSRRPYENAGCNGGWPWSALTYIKDNGGINTEWAYPYEGVQRNCRYNWNQVAATVRDVAYVQQNENSLAAAVANNGPISVCVDADQFQFYKGGVFNTNYCTGPVNHAVLVAGYGRDNVGGDFWLVKNSWGPGWGEGGYIRMARNRNNQCKIADFAVFPVV